MRKLVHHEGIRSHDVQEANISLRVFMRAREVRDRLCFALVVYRAVVSEVLHAAVGADALRRIRADVGRRATHSRYTHPSNGQAPASSNGIGGPCCEAAGTPASKMPATHNGNAMRIDDNRRT
jgi:hypothetical protein